MSTIPRLYAFNINQGMSANAAEARPTSIFSHDGNGREAVVAAQACVWPSFFGVEHSYHSCALKCGMYPPDLLTNRSCGTAHAL